MYDVLPLAIIPMHDIEGRCCWLRGYAHGLLTASASRCPRLSSVVFHQRPATMGRSSFGRLRLLRRTPQMGCTESWTRLIRVTRDRCTNPSRPRRRLATSSPSTTSSLTTTPMARTTPNIPAVEPQPRKAAADSRRVTIDALFARQSSQAPSSSPPRPSQSEGKLRLSGPRIRKLAPLPMPPSRTRASLQRSRATLSQSENTRGAAHLSQTSAPESTPSIRTRSTDKRDAGATTEGVRGREHLAPATNASRKTQTAPSISSRHFSTTQGSTPAQGGTLTKSIPRKRALPADDTQAPPSAQIRTSPRKAARSSTTQPLAPKANILPSPSESASSRKRPRLAAPEPQNASQLETLNLSQVTDPYEVVPSSQSDEQELIAPKVTKKDPTAVKEAVDLWRREAETDVRLEEPVDLPRPDAEVAMDVDGPEESLGSPLSSIPTGLQTPRSEADMRPSSPPPLTLSSPASCHTAVAAPMVAPLTSSSTPLTPTSLLFTSERPITPPPEAHAPPVPPALVALDQESRTAQIIADIKARAYAAALSSPESVCAELKELGYHDSSSDESEEDFMVAFNKFDKGKGKA